MKKYQGFGTLNRKIHEGEHNLCEEDNRTKEVGLTKEEEFVATRLYWKEF